MATLSAPLTDPGRPLAAICRDGARVVLDSWLSRRLCAASVHLLLDLAGRPDHAPVSPREAWWLHGCIVALMEAELAYGSEVRL